MLAIVISPASFSQEWDENMKLFWKNCIISGYSTALIIIRRLSRQQWMLFPIVWITANKLITTTSPQPLPLPHTIKCRGTKAALVAKRTRTTRTRKANYFAPSVEAVDTLGRIAQMNLMMMINLLPVVIATLDSMGTKSTYVAVAPLIQIVGKMLLTCNVVIVKFSFAKLETAGVCWSNLVW